MKNMPKNINHIFRSLCTWLHIWRRLRRASLFDILLLLLFKEKKAACGGPGCLTLCFYYTYIIVLPPAAGLIVWHCAFITWIFFRLRRAWLFDMLLVNLRLRRAWLFDLCCWCHDTSNYHATSLKKEHKIHINKNGKMHMAQKLQTTLMA